MKNIVGHIQQKDQITRLIESGRSHGFFLTGSECIGKYSIARVLAAHYGQNNHSKKTLEWSIVDVLSKYTNIQIISPENVVQKGIVRTKKITVDAIRRTTRQLSFRATGDAYNILIINDAHEMHRAASNALLKILEEPPAQTLIFVVTSESGRIPSTVKSRMSRIIFSHLPDGELAKISSDKQKRLNAFGRPGMLVDYVDDPDAYAQAEKSLSLLKEMRSLHAHERLKYAHEISKDAIKAIQILTLWTLRIHDIAHMQKMYHILPMAGKVEDAIQTLRTTNTNKRLVLEELFVRL